MCRRGLAAAAGTDAEGTCSTLSIIRSLARLHHKRGDNAAAAEYYRQVLAGREALLGPDHLETLASLDELGAFYSDQQDYLSAEPLLRRALAGRKASLGAEHPDTLTTMCNLGSLLLIQGDSCPCPLHGHVDRRVFGFHPIEHRPGDGEAHDLLTKVFNGRFDILGELHKDAIASIFRWSLVGNYAIRKSLIQGELAEDGTLPFPRFADSMQRPIDLYLSPLSRPNRFPDPPGTITNSLGMKFVPIPAGEFPMGCPEAEEALLGLRYFRENDECEHQVRITRPFFLGMHQVTQAQYEQVMGINPSFYKWHDLPVSHLAWSEARQFCESLSILPEERAAGRLYRLPTEAEWEYACRARTGTPFNTGHILRPHEACFLRTNRTVEFIKYSSVREEFFGTWPGDVLSEWGIDWNESRLGHAFCEICQRHGYAIVKAGPSPPCPACHSQFSRFSWIDLDSDVWVGAVPPGNDGIGDVLRDLKEGGYSVSGEMTRSLEWAMPRRPRSVGMYPPNAWGLFDMHGNVWEWTNDWFSKDYLRDCPIDDPQGPVSGKRHTLRGGSASATEFECRTALRATVSEDSPLVRSPEELLDRVSKMLPKELERVMRNAHKRRRLHGDFGVRVVCECDR